MSDSTLRIEIPERVQRLVILGDPHGDVSGVNAIFEREETPETRLACVGDVVGYADGPRSSELCALLALRGIPTVQGNHEDWIDPQGRLAIVESRGADRKLTLRALEWTRALPATIHFVREDTKVLLALLTHSIREPGWDWIEPDNVVEFLDDLGWPSLVITGHSHRAKLIQVNRSGEVRRTSFNYHEDAGCDHAFPRSGSLILDAGSVARPEATELTGVKEPHDGARFGTYGVVDFERKTAGLRRIEKGR